MKVGDTYKTEVKTSVADEADVIVAGGGAAGCVAAIAAARSGVKTLLVEHHGFLGGMMTAGNAGLTKYVVHSTDQTDYKKVLEQLSKNPSDVQIVGGIPMEITRRLLDMKAGIGTNGTAGSYVFTASEDFKWLLLTMIEEAGVKLLLHSWIVDVIKEDNVIKGIVVENKSGRQAILGKMFVDCTGDGDVAAKAGAPFEVGVGHNDLAAKHGTRLNTMQEMGVMFRVGNVDMIRCFEYLRKNPDKFQVQGCALLNLEQAWKNFQKGEMMTINITTDFAFPCFQIYNTPLHGIFTICCPCCPGSGLSASDLTKAEIALTKKVREWILKMREMPGFENTFLVNCPQVGVRETRHILGKYVLTIKDVFSSREFEDGIGKGSHPIDVQPIPEALRKRALPPRWQFNIPYRCLVPKEIDNLLVAGRCISVTHEAFGCTRSTVQCMITGEASGTASAMCIKQNVSPKNLNTDELRKTLTDQGVVL